MGAEEDLKDNESKKMEGRGMFDMGTIFAGALSGAAARILTAPFDVLKIRFQIQYGSHSQHAPAPRAYKYTHVLQGLFTIVEEEGILALWKGNLSAMYLWALYSMVQFGVYKTLKQQGELMFTPLATLTSQSLISTHSFILFTAGACAGVVATASTYPLDLMRTHFSIQGNHGVITTIPQFIKHTYNNVANSLNHISSPGTGIGIGTSRGGIRAFYRGLSPALVGVAPYMGLNFALHDWLKNILDSNSNSSSGGTGTGVWHMSSTIRSSTAGGFSGFLSKLAMYPLDTVKKRMQLLALATSTTRTVVPLPLPLQQYNTIWNCCKHIFRNEGMQAFYKGLTPSLIKAGISTSVVFGSYESFYGIYNEYWDGYKRQ